MEQLEWGHYAIWKWDIQGASQSPKNLKKNWLLHMHFGLIVTN